MIMTLVLTKKKIATWIDIDRKEEKPEDKKTAPTEEGESVGAIN